MSFIQVIDFETDRPDKMQALLEEWGNAAEGATVTATLTQDRDRPSRYLMLVEFPSYEEAMANSDLPETDAYARRMSELCTGQPTFLNLDVVRRDLS